MRTRIPQQLPQRLEWLVAGKQGMTMRCHISTQCRQRTQPSDTKFSFDAHGLPTLGVPANQKRRPAQDPHITR